MEHIYCIIGLSIIVLTLLYYYLTSTFGYWRQRQIPCPKGILPGFGHVYSLIFMKRNMSDMFRDLYDKMPGCSMIGFYHLRDPSLMVREPELVKTVLSKNFQNFARNMAEIDKERDPLLALNPFFNEGDLWKTLRQQLTVAFTSGKLKYMYESVNDACVKLNGFVDKQIKNNNGEAELELKDLFSRFTAEAVASAAFGIDGKSFGSHEDGPFRKIGRLMFEPTLVKGLRQMVLLFFPFLGKIFNSAFMPVEVDQFFRRVVNDALKYREENGIKRPDFLQLMIQLKKSDQDFNQDVITSHASSFFIDGYETSSITLSFFAYLLAAHPEIQGRLREEVTNVVTKHGGLNYEAIQEMTYMDQALNESMRLFPAAGALLKLCTQEMELIGTDGITCRVAPGTNVVIPISALHMDPEYWSEPEKFDPDRFSEDNKNSQHKFVHLPFGGGPRACPGMRMAVMQMKASIATIIQRFTWTVSPRTKEPIQLDPNYFMSAAIGGLWVKIKSLY